MEIEKRAFIKNISKIKEKLTELGAKKTKDVHIIDYWICENKINKFEDAQQHEPGSYGLRVREKVTTEGSKWEFNCKVLDKKGDHNAFHEHETAVVDGKATLEILKSIGFKVFCILDKKREMYSFETITINLEDIKGFRPAIELEIIDNKNIEENKNILDKLLQDLGVKKQDLIEKSITYLYMKEFSFK